MNRRPIRPLLLMKLSRCFIAVASLCLAQPLFAAETQTQTPKPAKPKETVPTPSGPQTDGAFVKVILDADHEVDGVLQDTVVDPMELAVAKDGRVFWAERKGVIKMWKPGTRTTTVIARIPVFDGLEDGMLGMALHPDFLKNNWVT